MGENDFLYIYTDSTGKLVQISKNEKQNFKIVFNKSEQISYIENSNKGRESVWINNGKSDLMFEKEESSVKSRTIIRNNRFPVVSSIITLKRDGINYLSEDRVFDFLKMKVRETQNTEYLTLENDVDLIPGKKTELKFKIKSKLNEHLLLKGNFTKDFLSNKVDTIHIKEEFTYSYQPHTKNDTIRFIVYNFDKSTGMGKSIYFELPIKSLIK